MKVAIVCAITASVIYVAPALWWVGVVVVIWGVFHDDVPAQYVEDDD